MSECSSSNACEWDLTASICAPRSVEMSTRLIGGPAQYEGRVDYFHQGAWTPVCGTRWTDIDARVACLQLGFGGGTSLFFAAPTQQVALSLTCTGSETSLAQCSRVSELGCTRAAGARCFGPTCGYLPQRRCQQEIECRWNASMEYCEHLRGTEVHGCMANIECPRQWPVCLQGVCTCPPPWLGERCDILQENPLFWSTPSLYSSHLQSQANANILWEYAGAVYWKDAEGTCVYVTKTANGSTVPVSIGVNAFDCNATVGTVANASAFILTLVQCSGLSDYGVPRQGFCEVVMSKLDLTTDLVDPTWPRVFDVCSSSGGCRFVVAGPVYDTATSSVIFLSSEHPSAPFRFHRVHESGLFTRNWRQLQLLDSLVVMQIHVEARLVLLVGSTTTFVLPLYEINTIYPRRASAPFQGSLITVLGEGFPESCIAHCLFSGTVVANATNIAINQVVCVAPKISTLLGTSRSTRFTVEVGFEIPGFHAPLFTNARNAWFEYLQTPPVPNSLSPVRKIANSSCDLLIEGALSFLEPIPPRARVRFTSQSITIFNEGLIVTPWKVFVRLGPTPPGEYAVSVALHGEQYSNPLQFSSIGPPSRAVMVPNTIERSCNMSLILPLIHIQFVDASSVNVQELFGDFTGRISLLNFYSGEPVPFMPVREVLIRMGGATLSDLMLTAPSIGRYTLHLASVRNTTSLIDITENIPHSLKITTELLPFSTNLELLGIQPTVIIVDECENLVTRDTTRVITAIVNWVDQVGARQVQVSNHSTLANKGRAQFQNLQITGLAGELYSVSYESEGLRSASQCCTRFAYCSSGMQSVVHEISPATVPFGSHVVTVTGWKFVFSNRDYFMCRLGDLFLFNATMLDSCTVLCHLTNLSLAGAWALQVKVTGMSVFAGTQILTVVGPVRLLQSTLSVATPLVSATTNSVPPIVFRAVDNNNVSTGTGNWTVRLDGIASSALEWTPADREIYMTSGVANFSGVVMYRPRIGTYQLRFSSAGLPCNPVNVTVVGGQPASLVLDRRPGTIMRQEESELTPQPSIGVEDVSGNRLTKDSVTANNAHLLVQVVLSPSANRSNGETFFSGNPQPLAQEGLVTWNGLAFVGKHGTAYRLIFTGSIGSLALNNVTSPEIAVGDCAVDKLALLGHVECLACPYGAQCDGSFNVSVRPNFWRHNNRSHKFFPCRSGKEVCLRDTPTGQCIEGHTGPFCDVCVQDGNEVWTKTADGFCSKCGSETDSVLRHTCCILALAR